MRKHIKSLQGCILKEIHEKRKAMFEDMSYIFKVLERQQIELDQNIYEKSIYAFNDYSKDTEASTKKTFSDLTIDSIECMEEIQSLHRQAKAKVLTTTK